MPNHLQVFRSYAAIILFVALIGVPLYAQADDINPQIANCEEVQDEATLTQMEFCSAHVGCNMVLKLQKACAKVKGFLGRLKASLSGRKEITNNDVFEANSPALSPSEALKSNVLVVQKIIRDADAETKREKLRYKKDGWEGYYEGGVKDGYKHGVGVYITSKGHMGRGQMKNGNIEGKGQAITPEGLVFAGDYVHSEPLGNLAFQDAKGTVFAGTYLGKDKDKWYGEMEVTTREGYRQKRLYSIEGKELAHGPVAEPGKVAIAPALPEPTATERIAKQYDERINSAHNQCATSANSCDSGCAAVGVVGVIEILAAKGDSGGNARRKIQQCSDDCDSEKERCDQQVASLEREKSQAIAKANEARTLQQAQVDYLPRSSSGRNVSGRSCQDTLNSLIGPVNDASARLTPAQDAQQSVWAMQAFLRVANTHPACANDAQSRQQVADALRKEQDRCRQGGFPNCDSGQNFSGTAARTEAAIRQLFQESSPAGNTAATVRPVSGDCRATYARQEAEFAAINRRKPDTQAVLPGLQVVLYMTSQRLAMLDKLCQGQSQYAEYASMKQSYDGAMQTCRQIATNSADCVPRVAW